MTSSTESPNFRDKDDVAAAIEAISAFHQEGLTLGSQGAKAKWPQGEGVSSRAEHLRKAREFARLYSTKDLQDLFALCRRHKYPLGVTALKLLVRAKDPAVRKDLQRQAIENRWPNATLVREIRRQSGPLRDYGGKHVRTPTTLTQAYGRLKEVCCRWKNIKEAIDRSDLKLNAEIARALDQATSRVDEVDALISNGLRKVKW